MKIRTFILGIMLFAFGSMHVATAQEEAPTTDPEFKYNSWAVYVGGGWFQYYGDIARATFYPGNSTSRADNGGISWDGMIGVNKMFNPIFGLNANIALGKLYTQKQDKYDVTLQSTALFYDVNGIVSLSNLFFPKHYNKNWNWYLNMGVGNAHYRSLLTNMEGNYVGSIGYENSKDPLATEEGGKSTMESEATWKVASGVKYKVSKRFAIGVEAARIQLPSDRFDVRNRVLTERDALGYTNLLVQYTFGKNEQSLEWNPIDPTMGELLKRLKKVEDDVDSLKKGLDDVKDDVDMLLADYDKRTNSPDSDGDGVPDYMDLEPNTPKGVIVNFQGIGLPIEKDKYERNPDGSFRFDQNANPIPIAQQMEAIALYSVFFPLNSTYVSPANMEKIAIAANLLKRYPDLKYELVGSACEIASVEYNEGLSKRRANTVHDILVKDFGIDKGRLFTSWVGELKPLTNNKQRLYLNRRTDIFIAKQK
jgi:OmpA-OmpF porin, OOP family